MKKTLLLLLFPILSQSQIQIGSEINATITNENSGKSVSLSDDGTVVAIGSPGNTARSIGCVRIYKNLAGIWTKVGAEIFGEMMSDRNGESVSLSGDGSTVVIGSTGNVGNYYTGAASGTVKVYKNIFGTWTKIGGNINGEKPLGGSGYSVAISYDGNVVAIGAISSYENAEYSGQVRVLKNVSGKWIQVGSYINGKVAFDYSGWSVSLSSDGNMLAIGSPNNDDNGKDSGQVRVYKNINENWTQLGSDINGLTLNEFSGSCVELSKDGNNLAISGRWVPVIRVYKNVDGTWNQSGNDIYDAELPESSGRIVSLSGDGNVLAVGAPYKAGNDIDKGRVRLYKNIAGTWTQIGIDIIGQAEKDGCGSSVSLSYDGSTIAIGAPYNSRQGIDSGNVRIYNLSPLLNSDQFVLSNFTLYPNPSSKDVFIQLQENLELEKVNIYDTLGKLIKTEKNSIISVRSLSKGTYFFEVITNLGRAAKIIIVK